MQTYYPNPKRIAQLTPADLEQPRCVWCGGRISDDRLLTGQAVKFCSDSCGSASSAAHQNATAPERACPVCHKPFRSVSRKTCSAECGRVLRKRTLAARNAA